MSDRMNDLRNEAADLREPFSAELHDRVMRQVRSQPRPTALWHRAPVWRYAVAVAAAVVIAVLLWPRSPDLPPPSSPTAKGPDITAVDDLLASAAGPLKLDLSTQGRPEFAYLDQDAAALGRFVMQQLNQIPR